MPLPASIPQVLPQTANSAQVSAKNSAILAVTIRILIQRSEIWQCYVCDKKNNAPTREAVNAPSLRTQTTSRLRHSTTESWQSGPSNTCQTLSYGIDKPNTSVGDKSQLPRNEANIYTRKAACATTTKSPLNVRAVPARQEDGPAEDHSSSKCKNAAVHDEQNLGSEVMQKLKKAEAHSSLLEGNDTDLHRQGGLAANGTQYHQTTRSSFDRPATKTSNWRATPARTERKRSHRAGSKEGRLSSENQKNTSRDIRRFVMESTGKPRLNSPTSSVSMSISDPASPNTLNNGNSSLANYPELCGNVEQPGHQKKKISPSRPVPISDSRDCVQTIDSAVTDVDLFSSQTQDPDLNKQTENITRRSDPADVRRTPRAQPESQSFPCDSRERPKRTWVEMVSAAYEDGKHFSMTSKEIASYIQSTWPYFAKKLTPERVNKSVSATLCGNACFRRTANAATSRVNTPLATYVYDPLEALVDDDRPAKRQKSIHFKEDAERISCTSSAIGCKARHEDHLYCPAYKVCENFSPKYQIKSSKGNLNMPSWKDLELTDKFTFRDELYRRGDIVCLQYGNQPTEYAWIKEIRIKEDGSPSIAMFWFFSLSFVGNKPVGLKNKHDWPDGKAFVLSTCIGIFSADCLNGKPNNCEVEEIDLTSKILVFTTRSSQIKDMESSEFSWLFEDGLHPSHFKPARARSSRRTLRKRYVSQDVASLRESILPFKPPSLPSANSSTTSNSTTQSIDVSEDFRQSANVPLSVAREISCERQLSLESGGGQECQDYGPSKQTLEQTTGGLGHEPEATTSNMTSPEQSNLREVVPRKPISGKDDAEHMRRLQAENSKLNAQLRDIYARFPQAAPDDLAEGHDQVGNSLSLKHILYQKPQFHGWGTLKFPTNWREIRQSGRQVGSAEISDTQEKLLAEQKKMCDALGIPQPQALKKDTHYRKLVFVHQTSVSIRKPKGPNLTLIHTCPNILRMLYRAKFYMHRP